MEAGGRDGEGGEGLWGTIFIHHPQNPFFSSPFVFSPAFLFFVYILFYLGFGF
jgi:hypothetical protein